MARSRRS